MARRSFRNLLIYLLPHWARQDEASGALSYSLAALVDAHLQRVLSGLEARMPSRAGASALALLGASRLITRGRDETDEHYAARLRAWRYPRGHRVRGNMFALLDQISAYFGGGFWIFGIDASGNLRDRDAAGVETAEQGYVWIWDSEPAAQWARQWIVLDGSTLFSEQPDFGSADLWGGSLGAPGHCIGLGGSSAADWHAIRSLCRGPHRWLPAGVRGEWLVVSLDGTYPAPDATWAKWGELSGSDYIPARSDDHRYVSLSAAASAYAGDSDWANQSVTDLGTFDGDDSVWPSTITMPDASSYGGDATDYPATITLPDDGSLPS